MADKKRKRSDKLEEIKIDLTAGDTESMSDEEDTEDLNDQLTDTFLYWVETSGKKYIQKLVNAAVDQRLKECKK